MATDTWGFSVERQAVARRYRRSRLMVSGGRLASFVAVVLYLLAGPTVAMRDAAGGPTGSPVAVVALYVLQLYVLQWGVGLPFAATSALVVERKFSLSTQGAGSWALDEAKASALGLGFALVASEVLYALIRWSPMWWWLAAWALGVGFQVALGVMAPVLIAPLFFRFAPLSDEDLARRLRALAEDHGVPVVGVYEMKASEKTRHSNAALAGFGRTRRIIVTDTLLRDFTADEIETVLAHELAHQRHRDSSRGLALSAATALAGLAVLGFVFPRVAANVGFPSIADVAALPLLALLAGAVSIPFGPLEHAFTRMWESRADAFALHATGKRDAFASAMVKLHDLNLAVANPNPILERLFYSHPAGRKRVQRARDTTASKPY